MFRGINPLTLDAKGRLAIPTKYRERLQAESSGRLVVTVDRERCLLLYTLPEWEEIERRLMRLPTLNRKVRRLQGLLIGHATDIELDGHGRVLLPSVLREIASLERKAVLIGQGNKFELWDEDAWNARRENWLAEEEGDDDSDLAGDLGSLAF
ncbi:MAG: division/cell wall cluster transcriptional repressor MraZ [Gammaproteobacteria bacterium]|nr:division/cell wall cluster transcriptional repressor MraZ [Gammaproteobacteria bacterium]